MRPEATVPRSARSGGGYYGYKVHAAVCTATGLPAAWKIETAKTSKTSIAPQLLAMVQRRTVVRYAVMGRGYDTEAMHPAREDRGIRPVISLRQTTAVKQGEHLPRTCAHGEWTFAGADAICGASKWRCPAGECAVKSAWVKADRLHPLVPRTTERFKALYHQRRAVEREFGRLKHEWVAAAAAGPWVGAGAAERRPHDRRSARIGRSDRTLIQPHQLTLRQSEAVVVSGANALDDSVRRDAHIVVSIISVVSGNMPHGVAVVWTRQPIPRRPNADAVHLIDKTKRILDPAAIKVRVLVEEIVCGRHVRSHGTPPSSSRPRRSGPASAGSPAIGSHTR